MYISKLGKWTAGFLLSCCLTALSGCAARANLVDHAFSFDTRVDSKDVQILDYRYGNSVQVAAQPTREAVASGVVRQSVNINGPFALPESLYVKWKILSTGEVLEDTIDLKKRIPRDMVDHRIYLVVKGAQLYVYLISPLPNPPGWPTYTPPGYTHKKTYLLYPDPSTPNAF